MFLEEFNAYQLEGRYPDYMTALNKICTKVYTKDLLDKVTILRECLQEKMS